MKGADPELFVADATGKIVPVIGLLGGSKDQPLPVTLGAVQEDNVLAEFNIDPASTEDEWVHNIQTVMQQLNARLLDKGCTSVIESSHDFDAGVLMEYGPIAMQAGCDPDFNAWLEAENNPPNLETLRTAAGHIHFSMDGGFSIADVGEKAKAHDLFLGVPSVLMDKDTRRRQVYGQAGCFRPKPYGGEYRSLSNFWLKNEKLMRWAWKESERAMAYQGEVPPVVEQCINNHDVGLAKELVDQYELKVA